MKYRALESSQLYGIKELSYQCFGKRNYAGIIHAGLTFMLYFKDWFVPPIIKSLTCICSVIRWHTWSFSVTASSLALEMGWNLFIFKEGWFMEY